MAMRFRAALPAVGALLLLGATPEPNVCSAPEVPPLPSPASERDRHDQRIRYQLRAKECELEARRRADPGGMQSCYFGPEFVRISDERYEEIRQAHKADPVELWHAILSEPEDPNLPALKVVVSSKSGPNCKNDYERQLEAEIDALTKQLNVR